MAPGANKIIEYDPPGAIGLYDQTAKFLIRFDETDDLERPKDETGVCHDFETWGSMPSVVDGVIGRAREFDGETMGLLSSDIDSGATLFTRDMSIQTILSWDPAAQVALNGATAPGTIIARGLGLGSAQYVAYALRLDVVNAATFTGQLRWYWQDIAGTAKLQVGAQVTILPGKFTMLTATRRWISPTSVRLRYYVGDQLLGEVMSVDGSIGGGTPGTMQIGYMTVIASPNYIFGGRLDELMIVERELTFEEIEATWLRITVYQPRGVELFRQSIDDGFPISDDPDSDVQRDIRMTGQLLGFAAAQTENLRANFLPGRAYGTTLEQWEELLRPTTQPGQDIDTRRARCEARLRQRRGISIDGLRDALVDLLGDGTSADDLQFIAFNNVVKTTFASADDLITFSGT